MGITFKCSQGDLGIPIETDIVILWSMCEGLDFNPSYIDQWMRMSVSNPHRGQATSLQINKVKYEEKKKIGICWFLIMYSFLVGPQVAICRSIVNTLDPIRFDVTLEIFLFGMCWSYVVPQLLFAPEWFITQIERGCNLCVDITIVVIEKGSLLLLLSPLSFSSPFWLIVIELL